MYVNETDTDTIKAQRDLALGIAAASTIEEALPLCLDIAISIAGMDSGGIYLIKDSGDMFLACSKGLSDRFISEVTHIKADSDKAMVVMNRTPVYTTYDCLTGFLLSDYPKTEGLRAITIIPVIYKDSVIASLNISSHSLDEIPHSSREHLETIAAQIGNALARIKAEEEVREKQKELEKLLDALKVEEELRKYREQLEERAEELKSINRRLEREIAERKQAEIALRESEERYRNLFENSSLGMFQTTINGTFISLNESCARSFGYNSPDEVIRKVKDLGQTVYSEPSLRDEMIETLRMTQGMRKFEYNLLRNDGSPLTVNLYMRLVRDAKGKELYLEGFLEDITERKRLDEAIKTSERNFRRLSEEYHILLDALPDTLLVLSVEMEILWVNTSAVFHLDEDTVLKRKCYSLFYNESKPCKNCPVVKSFSTGKAESSQVLTSNNRYLDVRSRPIKDEYGHISRIIVLARDMTEKIFLQREAIRATHLASIGELAAGVAHEINNPLTGIINYAQIIANKSEKNSKNYDVCTRIIKEGDRIARIVKSLLSFARSTRQDKMPVDIGQIFTDSIILTGARMNKDGITFQVNISETLPKIIAEPNQIQQVFLNILSNARYALNNKYPSYDSNKIINVACEEITVDNEKFVRIMFQDNGCGVHSGIIDKVFNPFFTTKPLGEGTGLGLSISYGIINEHKGHIMIDSVEGEFTKVIIDLPVWEGEF
ncbi:MAG: PAS domain S-box protein [Candidatus Eremiobacterota bacterium]